MYEKVLIKDRLPEIGIPIATIDSEGNIFTFIRTKSGWRMPKLNDNYPIEFWLEEIDMTKIIEKAKKWDELNDEIAKFYDEDSENCDAGLDNIGEICAIKFGYL